ncbi:MAG TPA: VTT domain-containing protein [Herpetosiphonaceae bacterium]|nr:VTT domain-containing protein [Herpetosiphonaceae bacterium]
MSSAAPRSWLARHWQKGLALLFWAALAGGYAWYAWSRGLAPLEVAERLIGLLRGPAGPLIYIAVYLARPLVLFSATLLTVVGGIAFGPVLGVIYTVIGANGSALVAYAVGRFFGNERPGGAGILDRYAARMRENSFLTVMTLRFLFLHYDLVNYLAGFLRIGWRPFLLATALGSLPGTLAFVLFGASFQGNLAAAEFKVDWRVFAASALIFAFSIGLSRYFRRREARGERD